MSFQQQSDLFQTNPVPDVIYVPDFLPEPDRWFDFLIDNVTWNDQLQSRKTVTFGHSYHYQKGTRRNRSMPNFLQPACDRIEEKFGYQPNNCLVNYYPDGDHYISFHSDQDTEMQNRTGVTILSLGAVRTLSLRQTLRPTERHHYPLQPGSALHMSDDLQKDWQHGILKEAGANARISLSFRKLI